MVGGMVIEASESRARPGVIFVDCRESQSTKTLGIYVERNATSLQIDIGDYIWWHGTWAMWTPRANMPENKACGNSVCGVDYDIQIPRIDYSGVQHPDRITES